MVRAVFTVHLRWLHVEDFGDPPLTEDNVVLNIVEAQMQQTELTCMMRKWGLLTLRPTEQNRSCTLVLLAFTPLIRYLFRPPMTTFQQEETEER